MQIARAELVGSLATGAVCGACVALWYAGAPSASRQGRIPANLEGIIQYNQLWVGADGTTHVAQGLAFGDLEKKGYSGTPQYVRQFGPSDFAVKSVVVTQMFGENPWHYAPSAQFVITLEGSWYVQTSDGKTVVMRPGDVMYQDNTMAHPSAKAGTQLAMHYSGVAPGEKTCSQMVIQVERKPSADNKGEWS